MSSGPTLTDLLQRGRKIPGSRYVRDFCNRCNEPIRVIDCDGKNYCRECDPPHVGVDSAYAWDERDSAGYQSIAIRAMEDG